MKRERDNRDNSTQYIKKPKFEFGDLGLLGKDILRLIFTEFVGPHYWRIMRLVSEPWMHFCQVLKDEKFQDGVKFPILKDSICFLAENGDLDTLKVYHKLYRLDRHGPTSYNLRRFKYPNEILLSAVKFNHIDICKQAKIWGVDHHCLFRMLNLATEYDHKESCQLAKTWGANNFNSMLLVAAKNGNEQLCQLAKTWGANNVEWMLYNAADAGHENICKLAKTWGEINFTYMIEAAILANQEAICRLAKTWGFSNFEWMLEKAIRYKCKNMEQLARIWISEK